MPRRASRCGARPVISAPSKKTRPAVALQKSGDDREQGRFARAVWADQCRDAALLRKECGLVDGEKPAEAARHVLDAEHLAAHVRRLNRSGDAARREGHHEDQHAAEDHEIEPRRVADQVLGDLAERLHHQRAEQRAEHRADAADDRGEQGIDRDPRAIGDAGIEEEEILRVEAAARGGDRGRERHRGKLDAEHVDAGAPSRRPRSRGSPRDRRRSGCARGAARSRARPRRSARMIQ